MASAIKGTQWNQRQHTYLYNHHGVKLFLVHLRFHRKVFLAFLIWPYKSIRWIMSLKISPEKAKVTKYKSTSKMVLSHHVYPALEASLPENSTLQDKGAFLIIENNI